MSSSNHNITLQKAEEMVGRYRAHRNSILKPEHQDKDLLLIAETFDRSAFDDLLAVDGCVKIRLYYGMDELLRVHSIFVAVDSEDKDILPDGANAARPDPPPIKEEGAPCPDFCPPNGRLYP